MEYSSDAHSSQPATATQVLLTNLGVCLRGVGEQASILGPLTLTLLPFSWMASLDTFLFSYIFFKSLSIFSFWALQNFFFFHPTPSPPTISCSHPLLPVIISTLKVALSLTTSSLSLLNRPLVCAFTRFVQIISFSHSVRCCVCLSRSCLTPGSAAFPAFR